MTLLRPIVATALALACGCALAQADAASAKKELVQKVLQLQQGASDSIALGLAEQSIQPIAQQATAILQARFPADQRAALAREIQAEFKKYGDEVVPLLRERAGNLTTATIGGVLENRFTEDELKQIIAMLELPIYRKYQQAAPEMQKAMLEKLVAETRPLIEPKLRALQQAVGKRLGVGERGAAASGARPAASGPRSAAAPASAAAGPRPAASAARK